MMIQYTGYVLTHKRNYYIFSINDDKVSLLTLHSAKGLEYPYVFIVGMEDEQEYKVVVNGENAGFVKTNLGGKLNISVDLSGGLTAEVEIKKCL